MREEAEPNWEGFPSLTAVLALPSGAACPDMNTVAIVQCARVLHFCGAVSDVPDNASDSPALRAAVGVVVIQH